MGRRSRADVARQRREAAARADAERAAEDRWWQAREAYYADRASKEDSNAAMRELLREIQGKVDAVAQKIQKRNDKSNDAQGRSHD